MSASLKQKALHTPWPPNHRTVRTLILALLFFATLPPAGVWGDPLPAQEEPMCSVPALEEEGEEEEFLPCSEVEEDAELPDLEPLIELPNGEFIPVPPSGEQTTKPQEESHGDDPVHRHPKPRTHRSRAQSFRASKWVAMAMLMRGEGNVHRGTQP